MGQIDLGNAATIAGDSGTAFADFDWKLTKIGISVGERYTTAVSSLGDAVGPKTVLVGDTYDPGTVSIEGWADGHLADVPPIDSAGSVGEQITITFPKPSDVTSGPAGKIVFNGQVTSFSIDIPNDEAMTFSAELRILDALEVQEAGV